MIKNKIIIKRGIDLIISIILLMLTIPLFVLIGIYIKIVSPGSIFFIQNRLGYRGNPFRILKFRTMEGPPPQGVLTWTKDEEDRIIFGGKLLRDYGLDELPQLINIIKGEMSIVGPRPLLPGCAENFDDRQLKLFQMRPGVLSLAAIRGRRSIAMEERIELHVQYVENWSLSLDLRILWNSFFIVLRRLDAKDKI